MHLDLLLYPRQQTCKQCPPTPPACVCSSDQECFLINRDCDRCADFRCVPKGTNSIGGPQRQGGITPGALAGAIVGGLFLVAVVVGSLLWYRSRRAIKPQEPTPEKDTPASAIDVLSRPDPNTPTTTPSAQSTLAQSAIQPPASAQPVSETPHDPGDPLTTTVVYRHRPSGSQHSEKTRTTHPNPFDDQQSIQTAVTEGTNVIPIAFVSPETARSDASSSDQGPARPLRTPELNLNLEHVNVSRDSLKAGAPSTRSGFSVASSRMSYMTNASYASEFLKEAPTIVTPNSAAVRQVVGVVKAEVIQTPGPTFMNPNGFHGLKSSPSTSKPVVRSPLASQAFGPSDIARGHEEGHELPVPGNPFSDEHSPRSGSPASVATFGGRSTAGIARDSSLPGKEPGASRPTSLDTQAGTIIADIGSAKRVFVGPTSAGQTPSPPYRTAMGKLVSPSTDHGLGALEQQQQQALAQAQAQRMSHASVPKKRISGSSVVSATSTRADSILESFPFVPPSPISDRPIRSPPVSPSQTRFASASSPELHTSYSEPQTADSFPLKPMGRRVLGLSTGSQLSTVSSGLGSFPFQMDSISPEMDGTSPSPTASSSFSGRQRASLDTLAITKDLASYPLSFDHESGASSGTSFSAAMD